jgi:hypothetical protein
MRLLLTIFFRVNNPIKQRRDENRSTQAALGKRVNEEREILLQTTHLLLTAAAQFNRSETSLLLVATGLSIADDINDPTEKANEKKKLQEDLLKRHCENEKYLDDLVRSFVSVAQQPSSASPEPPPKKKPKTSDTTIILDDERENHEETNP